MTKGGHLRAALVCVGTIAAGGVAAQHEAIEACRDEPTDAARIACLEAAIAGKTAVPPGGEKNRQRPETADASPPSAPGSDSGAGAGDVPLEERNGDATIDSRQPADPAERPAAESIGAGQVRARQQADRQLESARGLEVVRYTQVPYRRLQVTLENGQVWRQIAGDTQRIRTNLRRNQTVDINESGLGGYQLRLNEMERTIRVERIQ